MRNICLLLILLLFYSCSVEKEVIVVTSYPQVGKLQADIRKFPIPILLPRYMGITDEYLFVYKEREANLFSFFQLSDGSYINEAGTRGQGPNEFNLLDTRSFYSIKGGFNVMEAGSNLLKEVMYDGEKLSVAHTKSIFEQGVSNNGFYPLADSMYLTLGRLGDDKEYCLMNGRTNEVIMTNTYPEWVDIAHGPSDPPLFVTYLKTCVVHPDGKKIVAFYSRFKRIRIYDATVKLLYDIDVQVPPCKISFDGPIEKQPVYYIGQPYATERYVYVLCANTNTSGGCELQVWSWQGQPIACYQFDRKLSMMAVSEKFAKIYALDNQVDNELYIYDLPLLD